MQGVTLNEFSREKINLSIAELKAGDLAVCRYEGIGTLRNTVEAQPR